MANIEKTNQDPWAGKEVSDKPTLPPYLTEPAKEAKMEELDPAEIEKLALASCTIPLPKTADIENAHIALPVAETLLAAGKVLVERFKKEWKEDAEAHDITKVDYPETGLRIQIVKAGRVPSTTPEALLELRKTNPVLFSQIAKQGVHAPESKKKALRERIAKLQGELLKAQAEMETYDLYDEPQLIDDEKEIAEKAGDWEGITWTAKRADSVRGGSIPQKRK